MSVTRTMVSACPELIVKLNWVLFSANAAPLMVPLLVVGAGALEKRVPVGAVKVTAPARLPLSATTPAACACVTLTRTTGASSTLTSMLPTLVGPSRPSVARCVLSTLVPLTE